MYEIKVLDSEEFDRVAKSDPRYSYVDETNMGFADREKSVAYVRDSKVHDLNKYLINHELEEMIESESHHEDPNGIRHKKFFKEIFAPIALPFFEPFINKSPDKFGGILSNLTGSTAFNGGSSKSQNNALENQQPQQGFQQSQSPFSQFAIPGQQSTPRGPDYLPQGANIASNLNQGIEGGQQNQLSPELLQRLKGNYQGRIQF